MPNKDIQSKASGQRLLIVLLLLLLVLLVVILILLLPLLLLQVLLLLQLLLLLLYLGLVYLQTLDQVRVWIKVISEKGQKGHHTQDGGAGY